MSVKIRSQRFGSKKKPFYRIVVTDSRNPRDGRFIEIVGTYNPLTNPATVKFNEEKVLTWLNNGAKPTDTVKSLLSKIKQFIQHPINFFKDGENSVFDKVMAILGLTAIAGSAVAVGTVGAKKLKAKEVNAN